MKQSTPGFNQPNRNQQIRAPNQQQQQQTVPKLKITNPSAKQPGSFKPSSSHSMFNFIREKKLSQLKAEHEALSVPSLKIKPIVVGPDEEEPQIVEKQNSKQDFSFSDKPNYDEDDDVIPVVSSSSIKLNFDDDENAMDGVESKKYFSNSNRNEPLIWKPVFNNTPTSEKTINAPPPLAPFSIKPKVAVDKQVVKNKISIVDYYSSNSNESNSNSQIVAAQPMQPVPIKPTETNKLIKSIKISNDKIVTKTDELEGVNEANKTSELSTEISKEKHKKKKKNKEKEKEKEKKHHHHGDRKEKAGSLDSTEHVASSPSSTASSTKKRDKKEKKELKKQKKTRES